MLHRAGGGAGSSRPWSLDQPSRQILATVIGESCESGYMKYIPEAVRRGERNAARGCNQQ